MMARGRTILSMVAVPAILLNFTRLLESLSLIPPILPTPFHSLPAMKYYVFLAGIGIIVGISALLFQNSISLIASYALSMSGSEVGLALMISLLGLVLGRLWVRRFGGGVDELISVAVLSTSLLLLIIGCSGVLG